MGMSASQARLLSLTSRMHDLEFQAQGLQYSKLDLVNLKNNAFEEYEDALDSTKLQMAVVTTSGKEFQDITYTNMIMANTGALHSLYTITNSSTGQIYLPEQVASKLGFDPHHSDSVRDAIKSNTSLSDEEKLKQYLVTVARERVYVNDDEKRNLSDDAIIQALKDDGKESYWRTQYYSEMPSEQDFLLTVAKNYLYSARIDINEDDEYIAQMKKDGNHDYWKAIYYQIIGYKDDNDNIITGRGFCPISAQNATDRDWLTDKLNSGEVQLFKFTKESTLFNQNKVNIFAESSVATDTELQEVSNTELIAKASAKYEKVLSDIDAKETKLDLQLARIDSQHNALKTEYDSVKQIVSKNIDRSFKSFNA